MKKIALLLISLVVNGTFCQIARAGSNRFARVGELDGKVEVQVHAPDPWQPALRNMPVIQSSWLRTGQDGRVELELDEGSVLRLAKDSQLELSDYTRLSTGQRITLISLDRGLAYFTGEPEGHDTLMLAVPGAQVMLRRGARLRLEAGDDASQIAVVEGSARFSSPTAELELFEGQMARVEPARASRFFLYREIPALDSDRWSEERDKYLATSNSGKQAPDLRYGLRDLDEKGNWIDTPDYGTVWKPKTPNGWVPFREGRWQWYDELGYTWIAADTWGWLPYHYGRWVLENGTGWLWAPGKTVIFKPGEVYWMREPNMLGWGPLAPGENWNARGVPRLYAIANSTFARWMPDAHEIESADASIKSQFKPKDPLAEAVFIVAPPSPAFVAAKLDVIRPALRAGSTRIVPYLAGVTYQAPADILQPPAVPERPSYSAGTQAPAPPAAPPDPVYVPVPVPDPVYYPAPVYTGIVVLNPPAHRPHERSRPVPAPATASTPPVPNTPAAPAPAADAGIARTERQEHREQRHETAKAAEPARLETAHTPAAPVVRTETAISRSDSSAKTDSARSAAGDKADGGKSDSGGKHGK